MIEFGSNGEWVKWNDYAALQAENERLIKDLDFYKWASTQNGIACNDRANENQGLQNEIDALKEQNERLRNAGDAMCDNIPRMVTCQVTAHEAVELRDAWLAAKGVQS